MSETSESQNTTEQKEKLDDDLQDLIGNTNGEEEFQREVARLTSQRKFLESEKEK